MRRLNQFASLSRAIYAGGISSSAATTQHRLLVLPALLSTTSAAYNNSNNNSNFSSLARKTGITAHPSIVGSGVFFFSATASASSLAQDSPSLPKFAPKEVVLYQYEACPFCNKVKAFLDYNKIQYKVVEVNPISKKEIKWSDYKKVPILTVDGDHMVDSLNIINQLYRKLHSEDTVPESDEEKKWLGWVDNHLVHVLSPNIYRSPAEALESFNYITTHGNFSFTERLVAKYTGAAAMYFVSKKLKKRHNITDERKALYDAAETWVEALNGRKYLGGSKPNLADLAVFGVLRPIRNLKSGKDMVEHTHIKDWYGQMESAVGESSRIN
ncbi:uncharacterized protein [Rutidosis leptorrhynchoides]|uniref:uncharacterized protein n=1 Tax=Rutidosis leptorrhynchoides TaxID=125765 RepID=UPI003A9A5E51